MPWKIIAGNAGRRSKGRAIRACAGLATTGTEERMKRISCDPLT